MKQGAQLFAYLKQLLKLYTRQRDKAMMLSIIEEVFILPPVYGLNITDIYIASHPSTLPRSLYNLLRTPHPCLQIRQRLQQRHRLCGVRR